MKKLALILCIAKVFLFHQSTVAQQNNVPLNNFYKEKFLENSGEKSLETFFPANESQLNIHKVIRDSSTQYYEFFDWLLRKHWITVEKKDGQLLISPFVDFSMGKASTNPSQGKLFRNVRGVYAEGEIFKKIAFQFVFAENQARFADYESEYFLSRGEYYVGNGKYEQVNAMIPGAARTKPFKVGAFDYAYSMGNVAYAINEKMRLEVGNTPMFIGAGYRSLFLSDNTIGAMGIRYKWQIAPKFSFQMVYRQHKNMYRKPVTNAVESSYENKFFGMSYFTYQLLKNLSISWFTGGNLLRGDSLQKHGFDYQMLLPIPLVQSDVIDGNSNKMNGLTGLNIDYALKNIRLYGQLALDRYNKTYLLAAQVGTHWFKAFGVKNLHFQAEGNLVPNQFYAHENAKLSYSHGNLPIAHSKGNNFAEGMLKIDYEWKRFYVQSKSIYSANLSGSDTLQYTANSIFLSTKNQIEKSAQTLIQEFEIGYRFNRRYNAMLYCSWKGRINHFAEISRNEHYFLIGLKTGIFNQYFDF